MAPKHEIEGRDLVTDIRAGVADTELMRKYGLSEKGLATVFKKLLDSGAITPVEFEAWSIFSNEAVSLHIRVHPRHSLKFPLQVCEAGRPENTGVVTNISEHGLGVEGLAAKVNEVKTLMVRADAIVGGPPITLEVRCRWRRKVDNNCPCTCGFYVISVSRGSWTRLLEYASSRSSEHGGKDEEITT
jgi:hypothetical protein